MSYILFADDNEDMRQVVRELLESSGHEVALAPDGRGALASLQSREPDLLILDLAMPGMSGLEVCRAVKSNPFTARVPVLMLTGQGNIDSKIQGFDAGADDYLPKPFDPRELRARVGALVRLVRREADRNPTSGLPGGRAIEDEIVRRVEQGSPFAVCYLDLDNFKPFADTFGFAVADEVIRGMGTAVRDAASLGGSGDFVGHIGGDDFIVVTMVPSAEAISRDAAARFRQVIGRALGAEALARGTYSGLDRDGRMKEFPLASVSTAVLTVDPTRWVSVAHLGTLAAETKRRAKQQGTGTIVVEAV